MKYYVQQLEWLPRGSVIECRVPRIPNFIVRRYEKMGDGPRGAWDGFISKRGIVARMNQAARVLVYRPHQIDIEEYAKRKRGEK